MINKKIEFHEAAALEYEAAFEWYFERSEEAAKRFAAEVEIAVAMISKAPQRWPQSVQGARRVLLRRFPFAVIYRDQPAVIQVLAVAHAHRRPGYWKVRL